MSNSDNIVLISISFDRDRFVIEVQTNSYDQLQEYVDLINSMGLDVNLGASDGLIILFKEKSVSMRFNLNQLSNREQILIVGLIFLIIFISAIFMISWLNNQNKILEKDNQNIISRLNYIESIPVSVASNRNFYSNNISILVNSTSKDKNIQIDRTQPLSEDSMMVWVNEVNFIDLFNWMVSMGEQGGQIEKMNIRKSKKDKVNAQISILLKTN